MQRAGWLVGLLLVAACAGPTDPSDSAAPTGSAPRVDASASPSVAANPGGNRAPVHVAPAKVAGLRWASGNVPRSVPDPDDRLPSLIDDPPGRALVASYVPRPDGLGWAGEAIEFYGVDRRWRRLSLGELRLPPAGWAGYDTYGAGALSPNGRWWAGPMRGGFYLVDLRDGRVRTSRPVGPRSIGATGLASFSWSPDSDEFVLFVGPEASRVAVPGLRRTTFPRPEARPLVAADGHWSECHTDLRGPGVCTDYAADGSRLAVRDVPAGLRSRFGGVIEVVVGSAWVSLAGSPYGNHTRDWEVVRTDQYFRIQSRLVLPHGGRVDATWSALGATVLGLAARSDRLILAYLAEAGEVVRLLRPGPLTAVTTGQDFWDVAFARDLVRVG